ncbi:MAG: aminopeptidase P family protein [Tissierellia bacterium]|nr:aminopeptidase P family protein [Tissierellia bacterium]
MIRERLKQLREKMALRGIDAYLVTSSDPHQSEYLADYYKARAFVSGFTDSQGTAVVTRDEAILWTDGRYFIQADFELQGTEFKLFRQGVPGVLTVAEFLKDRVRPGGKIGFDGNCVSYQLYRDLLEKMDDQILIGSLDFIKEIWKDRPALPHGEAFAHQPEYTGSTVADRIRELRKRMGQQGIDNYIISALDDVAYLYCLRGRDIPCNPVIFAYALISRDQALLFCDMAKLTDEVKEHLASNGVEIRPYDEVGDILSQIPGKSTLFFDPASVSIALIDRAPSNVQLIKDRSIVGAMKAIKNETELRHQRNAYLKDGTALVRLFHWIETGTPTGVVTEVAVVDKALKLRSEQEHFIENSFETIAAYGANASMPHYAPSQNRQAVLKPKGLFLLDSGGQYLDGTTDITRTIQLGELTDTEKLHYTLTLKSHISLISAKFKVGTSGHYLDAFSRLPLWREGVDYNHGTGHGVGYLLFVHEGPHRIAVQPNAIPLEEGMVVSVEPGLYVPDSHGVRIENICVVKKDITNEFGSFLSFEILSVCPIDTRPLLVDRLDDHEIQWLNEYNQSCYDKLADRLSGADLKYLEQATKSISR